MWDESVATGILFSTPVFIYVLNTASGLSEQPEIEYINMSHRAVAVHVIIGFKAVGLLGFQGYTSCGLVFSLHLLKIFLSIVMCFQGT